MGCSSSSMIIFHGLSQPEIDIITNADITMGSLSFIGSLTICSCWLAFPTLRKFAFKLVLYIAISDVLGSIGGFFRPGENCTECMVQAYLVSIFNLSSVLWTACITHCLYRAVRHHDVEVTRFEKWYHCFTWGTSFVLAVIPHFFNAYGEDNGVCWIVSSHPALRFIQFYIPLWLVIGYNAVLYARLIANLRTLMRSSDDTQNRQNMTVFWRMGLYPVVLVVCWIFGSINRIHNTLNPHHPSFILFFLHKTFGASQGLLNCIVYGLNGAVREKISEAITVACCRKDNEGIQLTEVSTASQNEGHHFPQNDDFGEEVNSKTQTQVAT